MMTELSLNILDIVQNSIRAGSTLIEVSIVANTQLGTLTITIKDNGCGMTKETLLLLTDPFYTTRTTRRIGLGIPFFKYAANSSGGDFTITSKVGVGTTVVATFLLYHIDRMPLGDITATMHSLITFNYPLDFLYTYIIDDKHFTLDTREFKKILGDVPFTAPEVKAYIKEYLVEGKQDVDSGTILL